MIRSSSLIYFQLCILINCSCQSSLTNKVWSSEYNDMQNNSLALYTFEYKNESQADVLMWLDFTGEKDYISYFSKQKGDYSVSNMIYENLLSSNNMQLGYSFLKLLKPKESFRFHFYARSKSEIEKQLERLKKSIKNVKLEKIIERYKFNSKTIPSYSGNDVFISIY